MTPDTHPLVQLIQKRIVVLDGAMGTMVQRYRLDEAAFRGERFANWTGKDLKGNNEILLLTRPQVIAEIHRQYFEAGSDIVETNTFRGGEVNVVLPEEAINALRTSSSDRFRRCNWWPTSRTPTI